MPPCTASRRDLVSEHRAVWKPNIFASIAMQLKSRFTKKNRRVFPEEVLPAALKDGKEKMRAAFQVTVIPLEATESSLVAFALDTTLMKAEKAPSDGSATSGACVSVERTAINDDDGEKAASSEQQVQALESPSYSPTQNNPTAIQLFDEALMALNKVGEAPKCDVFLEPAAITERVNLEKFIEKNESLTSEGNFVRHYGSVEHPAPLQQETEFNADFGEGEVIRDTANLVDNSKLTPSPPQLARQVSASISERKAIFNHQSIPEEPTSSPSTRQSPRSKSNVAVTDAYLKAVEDSKTSSPVKSAVRSHVPCLAAAAEGQIPFGVILATFERLSSGAKHGGDSTTSVTNQHGSFELEYGQIHDGHTNTQDPTQAGNADIDVDFQKLTCPGACSQVVFSSESASLSISCELEQAGTVAIGSTTGSQDTLDIQLHSIETASNATSVVGKTCDNGVIYPGRFDFPKWEAGLMEWEHEHVAPVLTSFEERRDYIHAAFSAVLRPIIPKSQRPRRLLIYVDKQPCIDCQEVWSTRLRQRGNTSARPPLSSLQAAQLAEIFSTQPTSSPPLCAPNFYTSVGVTARAPGAM
ncbi:hypothetical protein HK405_015491 [Cladochytrium tenue]|nr:hypothetical protein HK405_015491 [Cladochytrium tenue]